MIKITGKTYNELTIKTRHKQRITTDGASWESKKIGKNKRWNTEAEENHLLSS